MIAADDYINKVYGKNARTTQWAFWQGNVDTQFHEQQCFNAMQYFLPGGKPITAVALPFEPKKQGYHPYLGFARHDTPKNDKIIDLMLHPHESPLRNILSKLQYHVVRDNTGYKGIVIDGGLDLASEAVMCVLFALRTAWERGPHWDEIFNKLLETLPAAQAYYVAHLAMSTTATDNIALWQSVWHGEFFRVLAGYNTSLKAFEEATYPLTSSNGSFATIPGVLAVSTRWPVVKENPLPDFFTFDKVTTSKYGGISSKPSAWSSKAAFFEQVPQAVKNYYSQFKEKGK